MNEMMKATEPAGARRRALSFGIASALFGVPALALARPAAPAVTLALIELMPWATTTADGKQAGILIDFAEALEALSGITLQPQLLPYPRAAVMLAQREVDLMVALQADRLDSIATRLSPLSDEDIVVVGRPGTDLRSLADLKGMTIGRLRNAEYDAQFAARPDIIKYDTNSYRQSLEMLRAGRLDAVVFIHSALTYTLKSMQLTSAAVGTPLLIARAPLTMYASRAYAGTAAARAISAACKALHRRQAIKTLAALLNK